MAYLAASDKLKDENNQAAQTNQPQAATTGNPQSLSGASSDVVGTGNATGSTVGNQPAWTNIQAYMGANAGDTGTAKALENKVGAQFDAEKNAFTTDASKVQGEAQAKATAVTDAQKNADAWIKQSGSAYNYAGDQNDAYNTNKSNLQTALNGAYSGPTSYTYGIGADTQATGAALNDNNAFNQYLGNLYEDQAGGQLSSGGRALQSQLDVNNEALQNSRTSLQDRYKTLIGERDQTVANTTNALAQAQSDYTKNQNSLRDHLGNQAGTLDTSIAKQEADAKSAYQTSLNSGSGVKSLSYDNVMNQIGAGDWNDANAQRTRADRTSQGIWGDNLSYAQLQKEQEILRPYYSPYAGTQDRIRELDGTKSVLDKFYADQDSKYSNTADAEERQWNFIQDVLGNTDRKNQGFKVRD